MVARRRDLIAVSACALFGLLLAILPNLLWWRRLGAPWYFADPDATTAYLHFVAHSYFFHPLHLTEPAWGVSGAAFYPWIPFVPFVLLAKLLSASPAGVFLFWSAWSGAAMGALFYGIIRIVVTRPIFAATATFILLADTGLNFGRPFDLQISQLLEIADHGRSAFPDAWSHCLEHFRIVNPGVSWPFLGLFLLAVLKVNEKPCLRREVIAAISFGLLFYIYFYFWTAASLTLAMAFVVQPSLRRSYARIAIGGLILGTPLILRDFMLRSSHPSDWLERGAFFVPMGRFENLHIPKIALLWLAAIIFMSWRTRERRLIFPILFVIASLLLTNHNLVTRLQLQNFHWRYAWGIVLCLLIASTLAVWMEKRGRISKTTALILTPLILAHLATGFFLRGWESLNANVPAAIQTNLAVYLRARPTLAPLSVIAGDPTFVDFAVGFDQQIALVGAAGLSPSMTDQEWLERRALNAWLSGTDPKAAFDVIYSYYGTWNSLLRMTAEQKSAERQRADDLFKQISENPRSWLTKYRVRYVVLPTTDSAHVHPDFWRKIHSAERWSLWELTDVAVGRRQTEPIGLHF